MLAVRDSDLTHCGFALGRLSMAVERSALRPLWVNHETARVVAQLFSRGAEPIGKEDLLALSAGVPGGMPSLTEAAARRFWTQAARLWRPRVQNQPSENILEITKRLAALSREGMPPGDLALETPLRLAGQTGWALPPSALALPQPDSGDAWPGLFLKNLTVAAEESLERLAALERDFARWLSALPDTRSDSRLRDALVLLGTVHALTPRYVAEALGLTRQAAARLLKRLEGLGVVRLATDRQRWLIYLAQNAAPVGLIPENTMAGTAGDDIDTALIDRVLDQAYAALEKAERQSDD